MGGSIKVGWNPACTAVEGLATVSAVIGAEGVVLVTVIDSSPGTARLPSLGPALRREGVLVTEVGDDVCVSVRDLVAFTGRNEEYFTGFDEFWVFPSPPLSGKPQGVRITSEAPLVEARSALYSWMVETDCTAGLGDGSGLNFIASDPRVLGELGGKRC